MKSTQLRHSFIDYFTQRGHTAVASSSLIPGEDATLLFTNAGMVQFKEVFLGRETRSYSRAVTAQCCIRAGGKHNDLENVGYTARHHTFFEMLGNFSFGDYFKREAIHFAWEFLTKELKLPPEKLWVTVYKEDNETASIWLDELKVSAERFSRCGEKDNFWSMGDTGPCGPCTEIFYDHGPTIPGGPPGSPEEDGDRYVEIWNLVFMQFNRTATGEMQPLPKPSVDTGMGLERLSAVMQGVHSNYDIDLFQHLIHAVAKLCPSTTDPNNSSLKVIADHIRSSAFLIAEGVYPSNEGRGYVLRRIIRRALRHGAKLNISSPFFYRLVQPLIEVMGEAYPILSEKKAFIEKILRHEEEQFSKTLTHGLILLETHLNQITTPVIPGDIVFKLYDTYGFPVDLTADIAREKGLSIDEAGFEKAMQKQRETSQKASSFKIDYNAALLPDTSSTFHGYEHLEWIATVKNVLEEGSAIILDQTPFYAESGGQVGDTGVFYCNDEVVFQVQDTQKKGHAIVHYGKPLKPLKEGDCVVAQVNKEKRAATRIHHSATHLLHAALRAVLGTHVEQKGSLVTPEKTRFDFSHLEALTPSEIEEVEYWVNEKILQNVPVLTALLPLEDAQKEGAMALFGEKYGEMVRVLSMGDFSKELCGGTHAERTGDIGLFKIISESGISAGVRRIEAVAGKQSLAWVQHQQQLLQQSCYLLHCPTEQFSNKLEQILEKQRQDQKSLEKLHKQLAAYTTEDLIRKAETLSGVHVLVTTLQDTDIKDLRHTVDNLKSRLNPAIIILVGEKDENIQVIGSVSKAYLDPPFDAKMLVQLIVERGGGREDLAQGGAKKPTDLAQRLQQAYETIKQYLVKKL